MLRLPILIVSMFAATVLLARPVQTIEPVFRQMQTDVRAALDSDNAQVRWKLLQQHGLHRLLRYTAIEHMTTRLTPGSRDQRQLEEFAQFDLEDAAQSDADWLLTVTSPMRSQPGLRIYLTLSPAGGGWHVTNLRANTGLSMNAQNTTVLKAGDAAPDFTLADASGQRVSLSDFTGKAVVLNFWATWCPPCLREIPHLEQTWKTFKDRDVIVLGVNAEENLDKARTFAARNMSYPTLFGGAAVNAAYGVIAVPATFYIDRRGIIRDQIAGSASESAEVIAERVQMLLK